MSAPFRHAAALGVALLVNVGSVKAQILADSRAGFSSVQGQAGWRYGYYAGPFDPTGFQSMPLFGVFLPDAWSRTCNCSGGYWTKLQREWAGGNGTSTSGGRLAAENWAVRRWVSSYAGTSRVTAHVHKAGCGGNGVIAHLFVNGVERWTGTIGGCDGVGATGTIDACLEVGSVIDLALDPRAGNDAADTSVLTLQVAGPISEEPASFSVCPSGVGVFAIGVVGAGPFNYQWQYEAAPNVWFDATNGPIPYSSGTITASNVGTDRLDLALNTTHGAPPIRFRCVVTSSCGSATSEPATLAPCQADFTCDGQVDDADFVGFVAAYNILDCADPAMPATCLADLNDDGLVDDADFVVFVGAYNALGCLSE